MEKNFKELLFENLGLRQTIFKNTFWLALGRIINRILKLLLIIYAARVLGASQFGSFSFAFSLVTIGFIFADFGGSFILIREFNQNNFDKKKLVSTSFYLKLCLIGISSLIVLTFIPFIKDSLAQSLMIFVILVYIVQSLCDFFITLARAIEKMEIEFLGLIVDGSITIILGCLLLYYFPSAKNLTLSYLTGALSSLIILILFIIKFFPWFLKNFNKNLFKKIIYLSWSFVGLSIVGIILISIDTVMLGFLKNPEIVGNYSVATRIIQGLMIVGGTASGALLPSISRFFQDKERISIIVKKTNSFALMIIMPLIFGGILTGPALIPGIFGYQYQQGILAFQILILLLLPIFLLSILECLLLAGNLQIKIFKYTCFTLFLNMILNFILIPQFSLYGAAIASVISQIFKIILTLNLVKRICSNSLFEFQSIIKYFTASILMSIFIFVVLSLKITVWLIIPSAIFLYFLFLYIFREIRFFDLLDLFKVKKHI